MDGSRSAQESSVAPRSLPGPATGQRRVRSPLLLALLVVALAGLALAAPVAWQLQQGWNAGQHQRLMLALAAGATAAAATALGSLPALFARSWSQRGHRFDGLLQAYRFIADSPDHATAQRLDDLDDVYRLFRCRTIMHCADVCPKGFTPAAAIGDIGSMPGPAHRLEWTFPPWRPAP